MSFAGEFWPTGMTNILLSQRPRVNWRELLMMVRSQSRLTLSPAPARLGNANSCRFPMNVRKRSRVMCDRLLQELGGAEVKSAEIRFVVHKHEDPGNPRLDPAWSADAG